MQLLKNKTIGTSVLAMLFLAVSFTTSQAQMSSRSLSDVKIHSDIPMTIYGQHHFDNEETGFYPGMFVTERSEKKGFVNFGKGSSWIGASEVQHVDGYVCVYHNEPFTFPIGQNYKYRPVAITGAAVSDAAYFDENPSVLSTFTKYDPESDVQKVSSIEYWDVNGKSDAKITLSWDAESNIQDLTDDDLYVLSIIGIRDGRWEVIPSTIDEKALDITQHNGSFGTDESTFVKGSISTKEAIPLNSYDFYTLGAAHYDLVESPKEIGVSFNVYPNPMIVGGVSRLNFETNNSLDKNIQIFNARKELVYNANIPGNTESIELKDVTKLPGVYTVQIKDSKGKTSSKNLIIVDN